MNVLFNLTSSPITYSFLYSSQVLTKLYSLFLRSPFLLLQRLLIYHPCSFFLFKAPWFHFLIEQLHLLSLSVRFQDPLICYSQWMRHNCTLCPPSACFSVGKCLITCKRFQALFLPTVPLYYTLEISLFYFHIAKYYHRSLILVHYFASFIVIIILFISIFVFLLQRKAMQCFFVYFHLQNCLRNFRKSHFFQVS